ncbi:hypothetical protein CIC12_25900 [Burkholderia sp. SG-MS1]|uniref:hypothetical protein n=1 Tax=Paraburkholderia sp. SG-MS1 TaxID=2023741 RepID=UPI001445880C|nr:hypothetical protein [Paraburkholderia sp. SG-MS1]NKJ50099.1 hypothetical protein [Paraburkholderia sp. SG-MS1]
MGLLSWWSGRRRASDAGDSQETKQIVERIVRLYPQLRLAPDYEAHMALAVQRTLGYLRGLVAQVPAAREASAAAWATDPHMHAFFATPEDVAAVFSHAEPVRQCFNDHPAAAEVFAVLGMAFNERHTLGAAQYGATTRTDVAQTTVNFSDHQVRVCAVSEATLRQEIILRVVDQLALEGLGAIESDTLQRDSLEHERALLKTRLKILERQGTGVRSLTGGEASCSFAEVTRLQMQIDENDRALANLGLKTEALERALEMVCNVLSAPQTYVYVQQKTFLLDRMNVVVKDGDARAAHEVEFQMAHLPATPHAMRAFSMVRFKRGDLLPARDMLKEAGRLLI